MGEQKNKNEKIISSIFNNNIRPRKTRVSLKNDMLTENVLNYENVINYNNNMNLKIDDLNNDISAYKSDLSKSPSHNNNENKSKISDCSKRLNRVNTTDF